MAQQLSLAKYFSGVKDREKRKADETESKKKYETKRSRGFVESWKEEFQWIEDTDKGMICNYCKEFKDLAGETKFVNGNISYRIENIRTHDASEKHRNCADAHFAAQTKKLTIMHTIIKDQWIKQFVNLVKKQNSYFIHVQHRILCVKTGVPIYALLHNATITDQKWFGSDQIAKLSVREGMCQVKNIIVKYCEPKCKKK